MRILLDTNRYRDFCSGEQEITDAVRRADMICVPFIVLGELRAGFACGTKSKLNEAVLTRFLNASRVDTIYPDDGTTRFYATLFKQLREQGTPIPSNDLWIASLAVQHDMILASRDSHFQYLPQIPLM